MGGWVGGWVGGTYQEGHHGDGGEVMHANHVLGPFGGLGDAGNGNSRGVGGEDGVGRKMLFDLGGRWVGGWVERLL